MQNINNFYLHFVIVMFGSFKHEEMKNIFLRIHFMINMFTAKVSDVISLDELQIFWYEKPVD